jgi:Putative bacterial sensory transduction regulator
VTNIAMIRAYVEKTVREWLGVSELVVDSDGDIPVRQGSAEYYVRTVEMEPPLVSVFSIVLRDVVRTSKLLKAVNQINAEIVQARAYHVEDRVVLSLELLAETITPAELTRACLVIASLADEYDDKLKAVFGGTTAFDDDGTEDDSVEV